jgi:GT2 family glycosyltransferase
MQAGEPSAMRLKIAVVVATRGRGEFLDHLLQHLKSQSRAPDTVCISGVDESDVTAARLFKGLPIRIVFGQPGLTKQRNTGIRAVMSDTDAVVFFDDDFLPSSHWLERLEKILIEHPPILGIDGKTLADGSKGAAITVDEAERLLSECEIKAKDADSGLAPCRTLYGCNMAFRTKVFGALQFDERLPLYGWLEDYDFSAQVRRLGPIVSSSVLLGVHLGIKSGRTSGVKFGVSQIVNPCYLYRKGTMPGRDAARLLLRPLLKNMMKAFCPEPYIDRRGRVRGNLLGIAYMLSGRADPGTILKLK